MRRVGCVHFMGKHFFRPAGLNHERTKYGLVKVDLGLRIFLGCCSSSADRMKQGAHLSAMPALGATVEDRMEIERQGHRGLDLSGRSGNPQARSCIRYGRNFHCLTAATAAC